MSVFFGFGGFAVLLVALGLDVFDVVLGLVVFEVVLDVDFGADVVLGLGGAWVVVAGGVTAPGEAGGSEAMQRALEAGRAL